MPSSAESEQRAADDSRREQSDQHAHLHRVVLRAAGAVRELADEERNGEADAGDEGEAEDVGPSQRRVEADAGQAGHEERRSGDPGGFADHEGDDDADGDAVGER